MFKWKSFGYKIVALTSFLSNLSLLNCVFIYEIIMNMFYIFWSKQLKSTAKGGSLPAHSSIKPKEDSSEPGDSKVSFL
jgi:hypothetical protein